MNILFLGTSSGWPIPRLGCNCEICTSNDPKDKRLRPSILVDESILIDAPPDIYHQLEKFKLNPSKIESIILTHAHEDHLMGLYDLSHLYGVKNKIKLISTYQILAEARKKMGFSMFSFKSVNLKPFEKYNLNRISVWLIPVNHTIETVAVKIKSTKPIVYAPEFRSIPQSSRKDFGDIDLAIIDGSSKNHVGQARGHETIEEGIRLAYEIKAKKIYFTNLGHKTDKHEALIDYVKNKGGEKFNISFDGLEIKM